MAETFGNGRSRFYELTIGEANNQMTSLRGDPTEGHIATAMTRKYCTPHILRDIYFNHNYCSCAMEQY